MSTPVSLSVVMSVYNGADQLGKTIQSICNQSYGDFEFIIINDGSTDQSQRVLEGFAEQDQRIKIINQANQGLTRSLITGCKIAQGQFIARHDAGDYSHPCRFEKQVTSLQKNTNHAGIFSHYKLIDQQGETLVRHEPSNRQIKLGLNPESGKIFCPSHHGSAMFRKQSYSACGGYRSEFYFAQDLDLWIRMAEIGQLQIIEEILYAAQLTTNSISGINHRPQKQLHKIILDSAQKRSTGNSDHEDLYLASKIKPVSNSLLKHISKSSTLYFIGSCLLFDNPRKAKIYFKQAIKMNPLNLKAWFKLIFKS